MLLCCSFADPNAPKVGRGLQIKLAPGRGAAPPQQQQQQQQQQQHLQDNSMGNQG
jgi:hypothetical protein